MSKRPPTTADIPTAVYGCGFECCAEDVSYPADMLFWHDGGEGAPAGFYCSECWHNHADLYDVERSGPSLAEVIAKGETE